MKKLLVLLGFLGLALGGQAHAQTPDAEVRAPIVQYFKGHATGDPVEMRKAFLPTAHIEGNRNGAFSTWTVDEYVAGFKGPAADESSRKRTIDAVDVTGTAAMAKATLVHGNITFTDYFVLLKVNGEWKIANKVYNVLRAEGK
ncbi:nuclear transport factor 2 family protein [Pseudoduganella rhizocola]|uniref:nuclear transport factor 2 family protein n=1 Tax=Pseudoduganella rhizocola TaxID=3382643 RepID=UPI0038B587BA